MPRPGEPPLGAGESSSVPGTAAIANAIFDATGVRFRAPPFTPEVVRAALNPLACPAPGQGCGAGTRRGRWWRCRAPIPAFAQRAKARDRVGGAAGALRRRRHRRRRRPARLALRHRAGRRPSAPPSTAQATIERGRPLAALGDCAVCHTAPGGAPNAGGRAMETPFGTIYTTNLTPDAETGLGRWSFSAFQRAMREGISRDGHHLYPAFPYTAFAKTSDDDLQALYAYFMSQPAVRADTPPAELRVPVQPAAADGRLERAVPRPGAAPAGAGAKRRMEPRRLPGQRPRPLRRLPHAAQRARRGAGRQRLPVRRDGRGLGGAGADRAVDGAPCRGTPTRSTATCATATRRSHGIAGGPMARGGARTRRGARRRHPRDGDTTSRRSTRPCRRRGAAPQAQARGRDRGQRAQGRLLGPAQRMFDGACAACHHDGNGPTLLGREHAARAQQQPARATGPTTCCAPSSTACASRPRATSASCRRSATRSTTRRSPSWPATCARASRRRRRPGRTCRRRSRACGGRRPQRSRRVCNMQRPAQWYIARAVNSSCHSRIPRAMSFEVSFVLASLCAALCMSAAAQSPAPLLLPHRPSRPSSRPA